MAEQRDRGVPPPPLNVQPLGLLSFLQIKNGGQNPQRLVSDLLPTWDLQKHYQVTNADNFQPAAVVYDPTLGSNNILLSAVEYWRYAVSFGLRYFPLAAADSYSGQLLLHRPGDNYTDVPIVDQPQIFVNSATSITYANFFLFPASAGLESRWMQFPPMWIPPGFNVVARTLSGVNTGPTATLRAVGRIVNYRS